MSKEILDTAFYKFYSEVYKDRWGDLFNALLMPAKQVARKNKFTVDSNNSEQQIAPENGFKIFDSECLWIEPEIPRELTRSENSLLNEYIMDPASMIPPYSLKIEEGNKILDMCAAPGGKSLILAERLLTKSLDGLLICNDVSSARRERMTKVIQNYIPFNIRQRIFTNGKDGVQFGLREPGEYDGILLDAPCSGERHLLEDTKEVLRWSKKKSQGLAIRQYSLLSAAFLACKEDAQIVYSTCSISPFENDEIIKKLIKRKKDAIRVISHDMSSLESGSLDMSLGRKFILENAEPTEYGYIFLPDKCGFGPIYFCALEKTLLR